MNVIFFNINNSLVTCFESYGLAQLLEGPTRVTTLTDPILFSNYDYFTEVGTLSSENISDKLVFSDLNFIIKRMKPKIVGYRN